MKRFYLFALIFLFSGVGLMAQVPRKILWEQFTGASCPPCAAVNPIIDDYVDTATNIVNFYWHVPIPSTPDPMYSVNTAEANARYQTFYGVTSAPQAVIDGSTFYQDHPICLLQQAQGCQTTPAAFNNYRFGQTTPLQITIDQPQLVGANQDSISVKVVWENVGTTDTLSASRAGAHRLFVIGIEDSVGYATAPGTNGETEFSRVFRRNMNGTGGTTLPDSIAPGDRDSLTVTMAISALNLSSLAEFRAVAFVQDFNSQGVHQAEISSKISLPFTLNLAAQGNAENLGQMGTPFDYTYTFTSSLGSPSAYTFDLSTAGLPSGWTAEYLIGGTSYTGSNNINLGANPNETVTVRVTPTAPASGSADFTLTVNNTQQLTGYQVSSNGTLHATSDILFLSNFTNSDAHDVLEQAFGRLNREYAFITNADFVGGAIDSSQLRASNVQTLIYYVGIYDRFWNGSSGDWQDYLESGGDMIVFSQGTGRYFADNDNVYPPTSTAYQFVNDILGVDFQPEKVVDSTVTIADTLNPILGGVSGFNITRSGADEEQYDLWTTSSSTPNAKVLGWFGTDTCSGAIVRNYGTAGANDWKTMSFAFTPIALPNASIDALLSNTFSWFDGTVTEGDTFDFCSFSDQNVSIQEAIAAELDWSVYPNPASASQPVTVQLNAQQYDLVLEAFDLTGRQLFRLDAPRGATQLSLPTNNLSEGAYLLKLSFEGGVVDTRKLILGQ